MIDQLSIKRGRKVNVVIKGNNVTVTTRGVLRNNAVVGGSAKVLCETTKSEIIGILISPDIVEVKI